MDETSRITGHQQVVSASSQKTFPNQKNTQSSSFASTSTSTSVIEGKSKPSISSSRSSRSSNSPTATLKKHRKLVRSPEVSVCDIPASVVATIAATVTDVMGGGFTTPPTTLQFFDNKPPTEPKRTLYNSFEEKHRKSDQTSNLSPIVLDAAPASSSSGIGGGGGGACGEISGGGLSSSSSISPTLYTSSLPGLGSLGPLLLESPDDPPDFEYHTFSADSGNSQEGSGDIVSDPTRSCFSFKDTALLSMGGELSTGTGNRNPSQEGDKLNRLQSFLFKTSSSDDGKTAPEKCSTSTNYHHAAATRTRTQTSTSTEKEPSELDYYQYTLTSPNNPFLPEIIARAYRSESADSEAGTAACGNGELHDRGKLSPTQSLFAFSRSSSAEKSDSERDHSDVISGLGFEGGGGGGTGAGVGTGGGAQLYDRKSSSAFEPTSPGKHKRKLFSLNSPTREPKHHHPKEHHHKDKISPQSSIGSSVVRSLNPFLSSTTATTTTLSSKQEMAPSDLNAKREEFLRATMKICLVVSPPTSKLQLKSKSLTHLDGLDSMIACPHGSAVGHGQQQKSRVSEQLESALPQPQTPSKPAVAAAYSHPPIGAVAALHHQHQHHAHQTPISPSSQHHHYPSSSSSASASGTQVYHHPSIASSTTSTTCNKMCCLGGGGGGATTITSSSALSPVASGVTGAIGCISPGSNIAISSSGVLTNSSAVMTSQGAGAGSATVAATAVAGAPPTTTVHKKKSSFMQRKKPLLTRSEISSSEFFSVSFCLENGCQEEEFIPAIKGVTLSEALNSSLRRRNLSFSQIIITDNNLPSFLESGSPPYTSSFEENTDVENLVGRHLVITERDGKKTLQKAASFGSRTRPPRLLSSASTEETTESEQRSIPGKQLKQRWSGLFGIKNPHQSQLCELLNSYAKNGVPQKTASLSFDHQDFDAAQDYLDNMHSSWKDFVHCDNMSDVQIKIQTAIWELVTTEVYYIHALQTVTDLFLACLEAIQEDKLLTDVDQHKLFSNVRDICEANLKFWTLYLYPMVANSINTHAPLCIDYFRQGFVTFATIFAPYKKYCAEQSTCQFYCKELNRNNALFTAYLAWCESQKMCNRLRLADILVRPMQRLTKYNLLLTAIRRHVLDEDDADAIDEMIHSVENFVCSVNNHLTTRQENERLKGVMARIESYDVVDTNNEHLEKLIKQHSVMFDLCAPMKGCPAHQVRHLFMEGDHKYKDNLGKADVHCFLLTDILLVCKTIAKKGLGALKVIRQPYLTDRLVVQHNNNTLNCVYLNEFQVATSAFTLQCSEAKNWYESMKRAKHIYARLKQGSANNLDSFRYGGSGASGGTADSLGVKKSPINSSICSHVSSANNSHSGSVEWNDSRNISVEFEKTNSLSSDEGTNQGFGAKTKLLATSPHKQKIITSSNTLSVQPINHLGQSLPNLNLHHSQSNNTLLVPGPTSSHSGNLLSPSHRGISYPPPSPTRATLRRGMAFSASIKNPPLVKSRNITSQNSINWHQIPATPTPTSPQSQSQSQLNQTSSSSTSAIAAPPSTPLTDQTPLTPTSGSAAQLTNHTGSDVSSLHISSTETDV
ncbi:serine-rich adhesin for platelets isoform X2 [Eupeodes corollae]|uniref:serine-rich adhesin for platelets isoform X2 n=1 Tax=Eupeodes corollae TaxID=290404 RepID=UPI0024916180|nr:serine-rich adhesin for platelets isoform X2 [Eupeodes corollae]